MLILREKKDPFFKFVSNQKLRACNSILIIILILPTNIDLELFSCLAFFMSRLHWINISTFVSLAMIILNDYFNRIELLVFWWNEINRCYIVHQEIIKRFSYSLLQKNLTTFSILRFCKKGQFWLSKFAKWPFIQLQSHDEFFEWIVATTFCTIR